MALQSEIHHFQTQRPHGYVSHDVPLMYVIYWTDIVGYIPRCSQSLQVAIKWGVTL